MTIPSTSKTPRFIHFGQPEIEGTIKEDLANVVEGNPVQKVWLYSDDQQSGGRFGIWECTAGRFRAAMDGYTEFCHVIEGEATIRNLKDGSERTVRAGDCFVMEAGFETEWHVPNYIRKSFALSDLK